MAEAIDVLLEEGLLSERLHDDIQQSGEFGVWRVLLALEAGLDATSVADTLATAFNAPRLEMLTPWPNASRLAPEKLVRLRYCAPVRALENRAIVLAMVDPSDRASIDDVRIVTGREVVPMTVTLDQIEKLWSHLYPRPDDYQELIAAIYTSLELGSEPDATRLLNLLILNSSELGQTLQIDWTQGEIDITGLCKSSTREVDRNLATYFTVLLRSMTKSPEPANLGGLVVHVSNNRAPHHYLVTFRKGSTTLSPVDPADYEGIFG